MSISWHTATYSTTMQQSEEILERLVSYFEKLDSYSQYLSQRLAIQQEERRQQQQRHYTSSAINTDDNQGRSSQHPRSKLPRRSQTLYQQPMLMTAGTLRDYQMEGVDSLVNLYENDVNGILADERGLGKRLQCIGFICKLIEEGVKGPFLIATPHSKLQTWLDEFTRFAPTIRIIVFHGRKDDLITKCKQMMQMETYASGWSATPVVISSLDMLVGSPFPLSAMDLLWKCLILDTACNILSLNSRVLKELNCFRTCTRVLLMSSSPRNHLTDLWSLLNFVMPARFDDITVFRNWFEYNSIAFSEFVPMSEKERIMRILHSILKPFVLRREVTCYVHTDEYATTHVSDNELNLLD